MAAHLDSTMAVYSVSTTAVRLVALKVAQSAELMADSKVVRLVELMGFLSVGQWAELKAALSVALRESKSRQNILVP